MRLDETPESQNVDDLRGTDATGGSPFGGGFGGRTPGGGGLPLPIGGGGLGLVIVVVLALFFGLDPAALLGGGSGGGQYQPVPAPPQMRPMRPDAPGTRAGRDDEMRQFVARVLGSTEEVWDEQLPRQTSRQYQKPRLVLFSGAVRSACGMADAAVGPFYCPEDQRVYIDLSFYDQLARRFGAPGDFAQAYVLGHEIGHHIQNQLGILAKVQEAKSRMSRTQANALQVRTELQADCFAGAWAFHANQKRRILEPGDVEEGLRAAAAIGDDRLQRQARGYVQPESFTHGTSAQRQRWFQRGLQSGELRACDTFNTQEL